VVNAIPGYSPFFSTVPAALVCAPDSTGHQLVCTGGSAGLFAGLGVLLFVYIAIAVLGIIAAVKVVSKAGYSGWWVLIGFVPIIGSIFVLVFAFSTWPVTREVEMLRAQVAGRGGFGPTGYGRGAVFENPGSGPTPPERAVPTDIDFEHAPIPSFGQFIQGDTGTAPADATSTSAAPPRQPPAGWFPSPGGPPGQLRYWDGTGWTEHFR
jgi:energy-coupling factor transporter transmembrane protein EcfT